jgi:hypothetical protein
MKRNFVKLATALLMGAALMALASCSSTPKSNGKDVTTGKIPGAAGFGGQTVMNSTATNATVVSLDAVKPELVLKFAGGGVTNYSAGLIASNLSQVKVGDKVNVTTAKELAVFLGKDSVPLAYQPATAAIQTPPGVKALVKNVETRGFSGKITATDAWQDQVTVQLPDGQTKTIKVPPTVNLADVRIGDQVSAQVSEATLVLPIKP